MYPTRAHAEAAAIHLHNGPNHVYGNGSTGRDYRAEAREELRLWLRWSEEHHPRAEAAFALAVAGRFRQSRGKESARFYIAKSRRIRGRA